MEDKKGIEIVEQPVKKKRGRPRKVHPYKEFQPYIKDVIIWPISWIIIIDRKTIISLNKPDINETKRRKYNKYDICIFLNKFIIF